MIQLLGFLDDNSNIPNTFVGFLVFGKVDDYLNHDVKFVIAIGHQQSIFR